VEAVGRPFGRRIERNLRKTGTHKNEPAVNLGEILRISLRRTIIQK